MSVFLSGVLCVCSVIVAAALAHLALAMLLHEARFAFDPSGLYLCVAAVCKFTWLTCPEGNNGATQINDNLLAAPNSSLLEKTE